LENAVEQEVIIPKIVRKPTSQPVDNLKPANEVNKVQKKNLEKKIREVKEESDSENED
jgi:hypothetical protein